MRARHCLPLVASLAAVVLLQGCMGVPKNPVESPWPATSAPTGRQMAVAPRDIKDNAQLHSTSCTRHQPSSDGRRAFFGFEVSSGTTSVAGYFYCGRRSPAQDAGLLPGDRIVKIRGCSVGTPDDLLQLISETSPNTVVFVEIERQGIRQPFPIAISVVGQTPAGLDRPGRSPDNNRCVLAVR